MIYHPAQVPDPATDQLILIQIESASPLGKYSKNSNTGEHLQLYDVKSEIRVLWLKYVFNIEGDSVEIFN